MFFVDRDYDLDEVPKKICKTDRYSIENYYLSKNVITKILNEKMNINRVSSNYKLAIEYFSRCYGIYRLFSVTLNAFFYSIRKYEKKNNIVPMSFKKSITNKIYYKNKNLVTFADPKLTYCDLEKQFSVEYKISTKEYKKNEQIIIRNRNKYSRGKQELEFLCWFINNIKESIIKGENGFYKNIIHEFSLSTNPMDYLSEYAETLNSLIKYINSFKNE